MIVTVTDECKHSHTVMLHLQDSCVTSVIVKQNDVDVQAVRLR